MEPAVPSGAIGSPFYAAVPDGDACAGRVPVQVRRAIGPEREHQRCEERSGCHRYTVERGRP